MQQNVFLFDVVEMATLVFACLFVVKKKKLEEFTMTVDNTAGLAS